MLSTRLISDIADLRALRPAWERLLSCSTSQIALHPGWLLAWWNVFGGTGNRALRTLAVFDDNRLVGLAPLLFRPKFYLHAIPFRRLESLGSGESTADETCGDYLGVLAQTGREPDVAGALARALASGMAGKWDEVVFSSMGSDDPLAFLLSEAFRSQNLIVTLEEWSSAPYVPLPGTWEEYLNALKPSRRSLLRKSMRTFESWADGEPSIFRVRTLDEIAEGMRVLVALHGERWGSEGVFGSRNFRAFHDRLVTELLIADSLDLGWLAVRGEPVAAFYNFRWRGRVSFYQSGRRADIPKEVRVGIAMHCYLIRDAIKDGMREYDFMEGDSQYKTTFALARRPLLRLRVARRSLVETARAATDSMVRWARSRRDERRHDAA